MAHPSPTGHGHGAQAAHAAHGSVRSYTTGLLLSLLLTVLSFGAVASGRLPGRLALAAIVILAVAQLLVQLGFFLHLGRSADARENTAVFICTALLILIIVAGSLWVMHNANLNMMPTSMSADQARTRN